MSIIKSIYNVPIEYEFDGVQSLIKIKYNGKVYLGEAIVHTRDYPEFASEKVGLNIALSRARISLLKDLVAQQKQIADTRMQMYLEATNYNKNKRDIVDPTGAFLTKANKAQIKYETLKSALKKEKKYLNKYIENQSRMVEIIKIHRAKGKTK